MLIGDYGTESHRDSIDSSVEHSDFRDTVVIDRKS